MNRLVIIPDEATEALGLSLLSDLTKAADQMRAGNLADFLGEVEVSVLTRFVQAGQADELLLWGHEDRGYGVAWTSLPPKEEVVGAASANADAGLVNEVFALGRTGAHSSDDLQAAGWTNLEKRRGHILAGMTASPVFIRGKCIAVLTLVKYRSRATELPASHENASILAVQATLLGRLLEDRLLRALLGLKST